MCNKKSLFVSLFTKPTVLIRAATCFWLALTCCVLLFTMPQDIRKSSTTICLTLVPPGTNTCGNYRHIWRHIWEFFGDFLLFVGLFAFCMITYWFLLCKNTEFIKDDEKSIASKKSNLNLGGGLSLHKVDGNNSFINIQFWTLFSVSQTGRNESGRRRSS